ncbi:unnamed protein product [Bursaphelenchus xylophilus]|uniref:(pine wood nematode) hypothetical protein n=1 Tax=Bursaphelenchus xylophilus TaxID=6326 RepID=A0A1I7SFF0_BURXY|nr:unnamed protein product [Bursaphelenchus xylophilus]CAG9092746.1 unnamed protein product [Bursaphelenchus xylophilus]
MLLKSRQIRSSLPLEILLYINARISIVFFFVFIGIHIYKSTYLHVPKHADVSELIILLSFGPLEALRISWARRGNLTETTAFIAFSLMLSLAIIAICVYIGFFQNYVLMVELILASIEGGFVIFEILCSIAAVASFSRTSSSS